MVFKKVKENEIPRTEIRQQKKDCPALFNLIQCFQRKLANETNGNLRAIRDAVRILASRRCRFYY